MKIDRRLLLTFGAGLAGGAAMLAAALRARKGSDEPGAARVIDRIEEVKTADGTMEVFFARPRGSGPFPVLVQLMDGLGMRDELRGHARRAAAWGYYVVAPDLYYRLGLKGPLDFNVPAERDRIMQAIGDLTDDRATADIESVLERVAGDPAAQKGRIGLYGFCMGGRLTLVLAQRLGGLVAAGASIHPGGLVVDTPDSPHRHLDKVKAELYFGIADEDAMATPAQMAQLEAALKERGIAYRLEWHTGAKHGFMMPSRAELYDRSAAELVWDRMKSLFSRTLA